MYSTVSSMFRGSGRMIQRATMTTGSLPVSKSLLRTLLKRVSVSRRKVASFLAGTRYQSGHLAEFCRKCSLCFRSIAVSYSGNPARSIKEVARDSCSSTRLGTNRYSGDDSQSGCGTQANTYSDGTRPQGASWDSGEGSPELLSVNGDSRKSAWHEPSRRGLDPSQFGGRSVETGSLRRGGGASVHAAHACRGAFGQDGLTVSASEASCVVSRGSEKSGNDHLGLLSVAGVALAERSSQKLLLCGGAPHERWNISGKHNQEGGPAGESERLADGEHGEAEIDGVADKPIGTGRDEARRLIRDGDKAPCGT